MLKVSVYFYLFVMAGLFANQAWIAVYKYLEMEVTTWKSCLMCLHS